MATQNDERKKIKQTFHCISASIIGFQHTLPAGSETSIKPQNRLCRLDGSSLDSLNRTHILLPPHSNPCSSFITCTQQATYLGPTSGYTASLPPPSTSPSSSSFLHTSSISTTTSSSLGAPSLPPLLPLLLAPDVASMLRVHGHLSRALKGAGKVGILRCRPVDAQRSRGVDPPAITEVGFLRDV